MLTVRAYQIAFKLLTMDRAITVKELSQLFHVSERTIRYDLEHIKDFFTSLHIKLYSQPNKGIWIDCSHKEKTDAFNLLSKINNESLYYNQEHRAQKILIQLFSENRFFTASELAQAVSVNRNTVFSDMDYIDMIVDSGDLYLVRKPRKGFMLGGTELEIRNFYENLIQKSLSVYDIYLITESIKGTNTIDDFQGGLPTYLFAIYLEIEKTLKQHFAENPEIFLKENIVLMIIRILISLHRIKCGCAISGNREICAPNQSRDSSNMFIQLCRISNIPPYLDELRFIEGAFLKEDTIIDVSEFAADLITAVSMKSGINYSDDTTLYSRLLSHLTLSMKDTKGDIKENPFNDNIIHSHYALFECVKSVCQKYISNTQLTNSDSFVSYIALHFLISQRNLAKQKKFKAILVCATGRGAARIIARMIESEVKELQILSVCSLIEVETEVEKRKPDYIISVFPIKSHIPVIIVEPIPTKDNLRVIGNIINENLDKSILDDDKFSSILKFNDADKNAEDISQDIIITGLSIYNKIMENKNYTIKPGMAFSFLTHIMLLAHRCYFKSQYNKTMSAQPDPETSNLIEILADINVSVTLGEAEALLNFFERPKEK